MCMKMRYQDGPLSLSLLTTQTMVTWGSSLSDNSIAVSSSSSSSSSNAFAGSALGSVITDFMLG